MDYYLDLTKNGTWLIKSKKNPLLRFTAGKYKIPVTDLIEKLNHSSYNCLVSQPEPNQIKVEYMHEGTVIETETYCFY